MATLKELNSKVDKILDVQLGQAVTLARLTDSVEEHIKRTALLEQNVEPVKKHVAMVEGAAKFIALLSLLAVIIEGIHSFFK